MLLECCGLDLALRCVFFFNQKTAYELHISDWSSDVCSSDHWPFVCYTLLLLTNGLKHARAYGTHVAATNQLAEKNEVVSLLLREFEDSSADWLWQTDVGRRVTHVSARFARALSMDVTEVEGKPLLRSEEHTSELQSLMRISYAVFC